MKIIKFRQTLLIAFFLAQMTLLHAEKKQISRPDIVIADFEQGYGDWVVKGEAFNHPTTTIVGAKGFIGKGMADSWDPGLSPNIPLAGTLTSPVFNLERNFIRFLLAGRGVSPKSSLQLLIDGKLECYACGVDDRQMGPVAFDVSAFLGRKAQLVASDAGNWDFVAVDEIVASDTTSQGARLFHPMAQCVAVDKQMDLAGMRFLTLPINNRAPVRDCILEVDGQPRMNLSLPLAIDVPVDFWASYPLEGGLSGQELKGGKLRFYNREPVVFKPHAQDFLKQINLSAQPRDMVGVYQEPGRPQLSFTVKRGNNSDANGLFFYKGVYHLFYQYNPVGLTQAAHWGHSTSPDLFHWTEQGIAIRHGIDWQPYSGSGVVDHNNDSGLKQGAHPPILLFFSKTFFGTTWRSETSVAFSVDGGKTFREYEKNPLFQTRQPAGHDPKVVWYAPEKKWVMIIHDMKDKVWGFDFYESKNLLDWKYLSTSTGWWETPDLFPLPLDGDRNKIKWIVQECGNGYKIGDFNGHEFIPETEKVGAFQGSLSAMQTFNSAPDGRRIMMGRHSFKFYKDEPSLHVGGGMNIPVDVTLRTSPTGPRLYLNPVKEIEKMVSKKHDFKNLPLGELTAKLSGIKPDLFDIEFEWDVAQQKDFQLKVWDCEIFAFNAKEMTYSINGKKRKVAPVNGTIKVRLIIDRSLVSFYINDGYEAGNSYLAKFVPECKKALSLSGDAGQAFKSFRVSALRPTWSSTIK